MAPNSYEQWVRCITVKCGIPLTPEYVQQRLGELRDSNHHRTKQFIAVYGKEYCQLVISWFETWQSANPS